MRFQDLMKRFQTAAANQRPNRMIISILEMDDIVTFQNVRDAVAWYYDEGTNEFEMMVRWVESQVMITMLDVETL